MPTTRPRLVQEGDKITFQQSDLTLEENQLTIRYQQQMNKRQGEYIQTAAKFDADGQDAFVIVFIQQDLAQNLLAGCEGAASTTCTVTVNSDFQYGQDKEQTIRFLVYHDKSNKPYQHRFISTSTASKFVNGAEQFAKQAGVSYPQAQATAQAFSDVVGLGKAVVGDYLRNF